MTTATADLVGLGETGEGYSLLMLAAGKPNGRRFWWACGGCWTRSKREPDEAAVREAADVHMLWCRVHRDDADGGS